MVRNLKEVFAKFSDEAVCRKYLVKQRWNGSPICPYCCCGKSYVIEGGKRFKCADSNCYKKYSVTVGTVFHASNIPLTTWFPAMYIITAHKKGISSVQLAKDLGVTQKTAWFMLHRIRESLKDRDSNLLTGTVEVDETYMARKFRSKYVGLTPDEVEKFNEQPPTKKNTKGAVIGLVQRDGKAIVKAIDSINRDNIKATVRKHISTEAMLMTDESNLYRHSLNGYANQSVNHSSKQWTKGDVHTNNVENLWSVMKRGIYGIYHQISAKHLQAYCDEFAYRYNSRSVKDGDRFEIALTHLEGRLKYLTLTQKNNDGETSPKDNRSNYKKTQKKGN